MTLAGHVHPVARIGGCGKDSLRPVLNGERIVLVAPGRLIELPRRAA